MKRRNGRASGIHDSSAGEQGFWPSYTDMMSSVALILFFLMLLAYVQNMITNNDLLQKEQQLAAAVAQLELTSQQLDEEKKELDRTSAKLETARVDLDAQQAYIDQQKLKIDEQTSQINDQKDRIADQESLLAQQKANIDAQLITIAQQQEQARRQQEYLNSTQAELAEVRSQMQTAAFLRVSVVEKIRSSIEQVLGDSNSVSISDNGNLILNDNILFDSGKADLKVASRQVLDQLAIGFADFLSHDENIQYVDTIFIGGHADSTGNEQANWNLSAQRANAVLSYLLSTNNEILKPYSEFFSAAGYGATRPIADNLTPEGKAQNRRIEISIALKDESVLQLLDQYLSIEVPTVG